MGEIKKILDSRTLPKRDPHSSRLFADLAENIHIHFRDLRTVFSVPEFFEFTDVVTRSAADLKKFLRWHPQYREQEEFDTISIGLGPEQQTRPLLKSPEPHRSTYFDDRLQIELQAEEVIDEIHVHYRDYRLVMSRETFREFAKGVAEASTALDDFLANNDYERVEHPFRKAVVTDKLFESRSWRKLNKSPISLKARLRAVLYWAGGDKLESLGERIFRMAAGK
jgi:hypothetical protein